MVLNHMELPVRDLYAAAAFFSGHFGFDRVPGPNLPDRAILRDAGGFTLVLSQAADTAWPSGFHIGFMRESREDVDIQYRALSGAGVPIVLPLGETAGAWMFLCQAAGSEVTVEVSWRPPRR